MRFGNARRTLADGLRRARPTVSSSGTSRSTMPVVCWSAPIKMPRESSISLSRRMLKQAAAPSQGMLAGVRTSARFCVLLDLHAGDLAQLLRKGSARGPRPSAVERAPDPRRRRSRTHRRRRATCFRDSRAGADRRGRRATRSTARASASTPRRRRNAEITAAPTNESDPIADQEVGQQGQSADSGRLRHDGKGLGSSMLPGPLPGHLGCVLLESRGYPPLVCRDNGCAPRERPVVPARGSEAWAAASAAGICVYAGFADPADSRVSCRFCATSVCRRREWDLRLKGFSTTHLDPLAATARRLLADL